MTHIEFYLYCYDGTDTRELADGSVHIDSVLQLDGHDGFYDQYFEGLKSTSTKTIRFLAIPSPASIPDDAILFERLLMLEATIISNYETWAEVRVDSIFRLGTWIREAHLTPSSPQLFPVQLRSIKERQEELLRRAIEAGSALWVKPTPYWTSLSEISALYAIRHEEQIRWIVLTTNAEPSFLVATRYDLDTCMGHDD